jgi:hypothetical protein
VTARIDTSDFTRAIAGIRRVTGGALQKELTKNLHEAGPKIVSEMKGSASTGIQRRAASTIEVTRDTEGITLRGGGRGGVNAVLFPGGEYGGRKSKKVAYATRSPRGTAYVVRRRTTMQFLPHLGHEGYFFWTTMRDWLPKLYKIQQETVEKSIGGGRL